MQPVIASYEVKVTVRAPNGASPLTIEAINEAVEAAVDKAFADNGDDDVAVNATATRTDR